jgi:hypothetical protein
VDSPGDISCAEEELGPVVVVVCVWEGGGQQARKGGLKSQETSAGITMRVVLERRTVPETAAVPKTNWRCAAWGGGVHLR